MITVAIYSKEDCCLCDEARKTLQKVAGDFPIQIQEIDIASDPEIHELYKEEIPVITIQGERAFRYKVHETTLRKKLEKILNQQRNDKLKVTSDK
jgi:glutaredoxin